MHKPRYCGPFPQPHALGECISFFQVQQFTVERKCPAHKCALPGEAPSPTHQPPLSALPPLLLTQANTAVIASHLKI